MSFATGRLAVSTVIDFFPSLPTCGGKPSRNRLWGFVRVFSALCSGLPSAGKVKAEGPPKEVCSFLKKLNFSWDTHVCTAHSPRQEAGLDNLIESTWK